MLDGKTLIYIIDDIAENCILIKSQLMKTVFDISIKSFTNPKTFFDDVNFLKVDLFIIDVFLGDYDGRDLCNIITKRGSKAPVLFISGMIPSNDFFEVTNDCYAVDFIQKPYDLLVFVNRVKVLLSLSLNYQKLEKKIKFREHMVWNIFNYSHFYVVVVNDDFTIKLANHKLAIDLGFKSEEEMIGKNCLDFVVENQKDFAKIIRDQLSTANSSHHESITDMKPLHGEMITVRWFNSYVNDGNNFSFSIGIPIQIPRYGNSVESIRHYFNTVLDKDHKMIMAMKEVVLAQAK